MATLNTYVKNHLKERLQKWFEGPHKAPHLKVYKLKILGVEPRTLKGVDGESHSFDVVVWDALNSNGEYYKGFFHINGDFRVEIHP